MQENYNQALELHNKGYTILPIKRGSKISPISWKELQERRLTEEEIK